MISTTFLATAKNGELDWGSDHNEARLRQWLKDNEGKTLRLQPVQTKRSLNQNALYWMYLELVSQETGDDPNSLHEYFRRTLIPPRYVTAVGHTIKVPESTTELSKVEMGEYLERISALTGVPVPDTDTYRKYLESSPMIDDETYRKN